MCLSFKDTVLGRVHKKVDDVRTSMWDKLGFAAIRDPVGEKLGAASKYTDSDSTKKSKPAQITPASQQQIVPNTSGLVIR